jgi:hypothetical protein
MKRLMPIRASRVGLVLVSIYAFLTAIAVIAAWWTGDFKGQFVFVQLPIALQMALIMELMPSSLIAQLRDVSWGTAYLVIWPATALIFYAIGSFITYLYSPRSG